MIRKVLVLLVVLGVAALLPLATASGRGDKGVVAANSATVRTARCHEWVRMDSTHRNAMVAGMRIFFMGHVDQPGTMIGQGLPNDLALRLFDGYCKPAYADNFRLYRIYGDAAAFHPAPNR